MLYFSKKEAKAIIILGVFLFLGWILPYMFWRMQPKIIKNCTPLPISKTELKISPDHSKNEALNPSSTYAPNPTQSYIPKPTLFYFNPNTLDSMGWTQLGLKPKTILTLKKYLNKGGRFKKPEDLLKIYGLNPKLAQTLIPFIQIPTPLPFKNKSTYIQDQHDTKQTKYDINTVSAGKLIAVSGLPPELVFKIMGFRKHLGCFVQLEQLRETFTMTDSFYLELMKHIYITKPNLPFLVIDSVKPAHLTSLKIFNKKEAYQFINFYKKFNAGFNWDVLGGLSWVQANQKDSLKKYFYYHTP